MYKTVDKTAVLSKIIERDRSFKMKFHFVLGLVVLCAVGLYGQDAEENDDVSGMFDVEDFGKFIKNVRNQIQSIYLFLFS
jgi:hypothetical protein